MIYIYITLGIAVLVIAILALLGWKTKRVEARLKKKLGLEKSTSKEELNKAVAKFNQKRSLLNNTLSRNEWLATKGYIHIPSYAKIPIDPQPKQRLKSKLSGFEKAVRLFSRLKREKIIEIYPAQRNKYGIPYYEKRKSVAQQIKGIA